LRKTFQTDWHETCREGWQWANEQMIKFWWRPGSPSRYRDCFPDSSLSGDTESGINRLRCATLQCTACPRRHRHSNYDITTSPAPDRQPRQTCIGGGMHCPSASSYRASYASGVLGVAILSVRLSVRACFVVNPKNRPAIFLYHTKGQPF